MPSHAPSTHSFIHIQSAKVNSSLPETDAVIFGWSLGDAPPHTIKDHLTLKPSQRDVLFFFDVAPLPSPSQVEFRYRLKGYDSEWATTRQRSARYQKLPPGTYNFEVQAHLYGEPWSGKTATVEVWQQPRFYETYTFYVLVLLLLLALATYIYVLRVRRVKGTIGLVLEERNRIARECHDSLMTGFAAINWQLETTAKMILEGELLETISENVDLARSMVTHCQADARRIIYDLRDTDEVTGLLSKALADAIRRHYRRISVEAIMSVEGEEILLPPSSVHHLVSIAQESMSNALKHGNPTQIHVHLHYRSNTLDLRIKDNGKGFTPDSSNSRRGHFGILVMEERARKIGGRMRIQSSPSGTEVTVSVPFASEGNRAGHKSHVVRWIGI